VCIVDNSILSLFPLHWHPHSGIISLGLLKLWWNCTSNDLEIIPSHLLSNIPEDPRVHKHTHTHTRLCTYYIASAKLDKTKIRTFQEFMG